MGTLTRRSPKVLAARALRRFATGWRALTDAAPAATTDLVELKLALNRGNRKEKLKPYPRTMDTTRIHPMIRSPWDAPGLDRVIGPWPGGACSALQFKGGEIRREARPECRQQMRTAILGTERALQHEQGRHRRHVAVVPQHGPGVRQACAVDTKHALRSLEDLAAPRCNR